MESPQRDPTTPGVAPATACACPTAWADEVYRAGQIGRKTGRTARHTEQDMQLPTLPTPPTLPTSHARLPCPPAMPAYPANQPCPTTLPALPRHTPFPAFPACVILSTGAPHAHPAKRHFVKPFYYFPIYQNVTH